MEISTLRRARNHNRRGEMVMWQEDWMFVCAAVISTPTCATHPYQIRISYLAWQWRRADQDSARWFLFLNEGGGKMWWGNNNAKRDGLWWLLTSTAGLSAKIIPVVMNYFLRWGGGSRSFPDCGGGSATASGLAKQTCGQEVACLNLKANYTIFAWGCEWVMRTLP